MAEEREEQGGTTESTERIPPGSMPPHEPDAEGGSGESDSPEPEDDDEKVDKESMDSFPASDPPAW